MTLYRVPADGDRYLVLGDGQLGAAFQEVLGSRAVLVGHGLPPGFPPSSRTKSNRSPYRMRLEQWHEVERVLEAASPFITAVVNTAATISRTGCVEHPDIAYRVNATAPAEIARWCRENEKKFVHISDAEVFSGDTFDAPYDEHDDPGEAPTLYGDTKRLGERLVQKYHYAALVIRTSRLFSTVGSHGYRRESPNGRVAWNALLDVLWAGEKGVEQTLSDCEQAVPTDARAVAWAIDKLCRQHISGVRHVVSAGLPITPYRFAVCVQKQIEERYGRIYRSPVAGPTPDNLLPYCASLGTRYARHLRGMPSWPLALAETLEQFFAESPNEE